MKRFSDTTRNWRLVCKRAPGLLASYEIATVTVAEMLILVGEGLTEPGLRQYFSDSAAWARSQHPAEKTPISPNKWGNWQENAVLFFRVAIV